MAGDLVEVVALELMLVLLLLMVVHHLLLRVRVLALGCGRLHPGLWRHAHESVDACGRGRDGAG